MSAMLPEAKVNKSIGIAVAPRLLSAASAMPMADEAQKPNTITTEQAARLLMISGERVRQLSKQGWITKVERDRYLQVDVM